jgi:chromosome partitioning protein
VALVDADPQRSSTQWLARRPAGFPAVIGAIDGKARDVDVQWRIVDSAAGLHGDDLTSAVRDADVMLVPVSPSLFDMDATQRFLAKIGEQKRVRDRVVAVGLIAMRVDARTHSAADLDNFLAGCGFPLVAHLRDTQIYVYCARDGLSVFDLPRSRAEQDWEQWRPLTRWIARYAAVRNP